MRNIAIIGAGLSGICAALHLARKYKADSITIFEKRPDMFGRGVAYSTHSYFHLLNVRASAMSLYEDLPNHFVDWLSQKHSELGPSDFASRRVFGDYISNSISAEIDKSAGRVQRVVATVQGIKREGSKFLVTCEGVATQIFDSCVLCLGNPAPAPLRAKVMPGGEERLIQNPWGLQSSRLMPYQNILVIGTGLTAVDVVVDLLQRGFAGRIKMISRRGLLPAAHAEVGPSVPAPILEPGSSLRHQVKYLREAIRKSSLPWQYVFDSLRPITHKLWQHLGTAEKTRFIKWLRPYWDVSRHRMAPELFQLLKKAMERGSLTIETARLKSIEAGQDKVEVLLHPKGQEIVEESFDAVVNCTGLQSPFAQPGFELLDALVSHGIARPDPLHLGLDTASDGTLLDNNGICVENLFAIGPLRKGTLWESIALREIREQAHSLTLF